MVDLSRRKLPCACQVLSERTLSRHRLVQRRARVSSGAFAFQAIAANCFADVAFIATPVRAGGWEGQSLRGTTLVADSRR
jgi:hypothetical protein